MGIEYSAAKSEKPEAYYLGKDYYGFTDLFPPCAGMPTGPLAVLRNWAIPKIEDLPHLVGSRHPYVDNKVFRVSDFYDSAEAMLDRIVDLKKRPLDEETREYLTRFYEWAGDDPLSIIAELESLDAREAAHEYHLCGPLSKYRYMDDDGKVGRKVRRSRY